MTGKWAVAARVKAVSEAAETEHRPKKVEVAGAPPNNDGAAGLGSDTAAGNYFFLQQETTKNIGWAPPMLIGGMAHDVGSGRPKKNAAHGRSGGAIG